MLRQLHQFFNPYPSGQGARIQTWVNKDDYQMLQRIRVEKGTVTSTVNILFAKLVNELRARGITDHTREADFEDFICRCQLVLPEKP